MLPYTAKLPAENVNVTRRSHLGECVLLLCGVSAAVLVLYLILGACVDVVARHAPASFEIALGKVAGRGLEARGGSKEAQRRLQQVLEKLVKHMSERRLPYRVHVVKDKRVNAAALPGGHIVVFTGLLAGIKSENEIAMILAHELGHFEHRDHLRALGRRLVIAFATSAVLDDETGLRTLMGGALDGSQLHYSRGQELAADEFALTLLAAAYGHAGGAVDFFTRMSSEDIAIPLAEYFLTHPLARYRAERLKALIRQRGLEIESVIPY